MAIFINTTSVFKTNITYIFSLYINLSKYLNLLQNRILVFSNFYICYKNILNFVKELPNDDKCREYLAKYKWQDGFRCTKCGREKGCMKKGFKYHCYTCHHVESSTANTLFHKVKFGLQKAFCMVFEMTTSSKSLSSVQLGERYGVSQTSTWFFMQKVRKAMQSSKKYPLSDLVHVDEFTVGGKEDGKQGRSYDSKKKKAVIVVELTGKHQVKRVYIKSIDDYS